MHSMFDTKAAAAYLGLSPNTLNRWRWDGRGPRFVKMGASVRYRQADLDQFIESNSARHTSEGAA